MSAARWLIAAAFACGSIAGVPAKSAYALDYASPKSITLPLIEYRLENGLKVVLQRDTSTPLVAVNVRYHVGSKDDPPGRAGLAHFFEHLMFGGTTHTKENEVYARLNAVGATDINADTGFVAPHFAKRFRRISSNSRFGSRAIGWRFSSRR